MNRIPATVTAIVQSDDITIITFDAGGTRLQMMALGLNLPIKEESAVVLGIKATNIALCIGPVGQNSISNRLKGEIESVEHGTLLSNILVRFGPIALECITTEAAARRLELTSGTDVTALVKASELSILELRKESA